MDVDAKRPGVGTIWTPVDNQVKMSFMDDR